MVNSHSQSTKEKPEPRIIFRKQEGLTGDKYWLQNDWMISSFVTRWTPDNTYTKWTEKKARGGWKEEKKNWQEKKYVESRQSKRELNNAACRHLHILKVLVLGFLSAEIIGEKNISRMLQSGRRLTLRSSKILALSRCNPTILPFPTSSEMVLILGRISSPSNTKPVSLVYLCNAVKCSRIPPTVPKPKMTPRKGEAGSCPYFVYGAVSG